MIDGLRDIDAWLPEVFDGYRVIRALGRGGMGAVYLAHDTTLDRLVAIKVVSSDETNARDRVMIEARAAARLQHPNVAAVYQVGAVAGRPYIVSELVRGRALDQFPLPFPWRRALGLATDLARGLAAAHASGVLHRDIKPGNVIVAQTGEAKLVDFGIAKLADVPELTLEDDDVRTAVPPLSLTRTGAVVGTPLYMAPEIFLQQPATPTSDVYSLGTLLFELCAGRRPHDATTWFALAQSVARIGARPLLEIAADVEPGFAAIIDRCLAIEPATRYPSAGELLAALEEFAGTDVDRRAAHQLDAARTELARGRAADDDYQDKRQHALTAFFSKSDDTAEDLWAEALRWRKLRDQALTSATSAAELSLRLSWSEADTLDVLANTLLERALCADRGGGGDQRDELLERLAVYDANAVYRARFAEPARVLLEGADNSSIDVERYATQTDGRMTPHSVQRVSGADEIALEPGSYRLSVRHASGARVLVPVYLTRGETLVVDASEPATSPPGFVYVPPGRFLFGSGEAEPIRQFHDTVPIHNRTTDGFFIARHQTTFADWIEFLESLPAQQRAQHAPKVGDPGFHGHLSLTECEAGDWRLSMRLANADYSARCGQKIGFPDRNRREQANWMRFPVTGISYRDAMAYAAWLRGTGKVPNARLCREDEWERAARGADRRLFPHGNRLGIDDACFDLTYGRKPGAMGPDEVGVHPASDSPFGIADAAGNAFDMTQSILASAAVCARGGAYCFQRFTAALTNREVVDPGLRSSLIGVRIAADIHRV